MIILGLDISTANIGYTLVKSGSPQGHELIKADSITIHDIKGLYEKAAYARECLINECKDYTIDIIVIEESLKSFRKGLSSPAVIALLTRFNGIISFIVRDTFKAPVHFVDVKTARKCVGIAILKDKDTKEQVFEWARNREIMKDYVWPTKVMKSGKRKNQTVFEPRCYDISDALVMSL
jgi:hypothetical protein